MRKANALIHETSPYLLQHAYNPVAWLPWGPEAFQKARREDKPVFLSIGYSSCHWCHVMAKESFEDDEVAARLNRDFVPVKVDREERPDVDNLYLRACQSMTGGGGWPASIFMDAQGRPFYTGTYFPRDMLLRLLEAVAAAWRSGRDALLKTGEQVASALGRERGVGPEAEAPVEEAAAMFRTYFDGEFGGFGDAPKFPSAHNLLFLLRTAPELAEKTLLCMYRGGIFDHIGGGFSRYSTDRLWLVPHFEKMLCDNALLALTYLLAWEQTEKPLYRAVADRIFSYLERELRQGNGGFSAAQDADSEGVEGKYYLFAPEEILGVLGRERGAAFCRRYAITPEGNCEGKSVPNLLSADGEDPKEAGGEELSAVYAYRSARAPLHTDGKQLAAWNALAAAAYAAAGRILKEDRYLERARATLDFLERELIRDGELFACVTDGRRSGPGFLDDYAYYLFALLQMHQATMDGRLLSRAAALSEQIRARFWDARDGGFFFSGTKNEALIARPKETADGALPSGNSVMAYNLSRLALLTDDERVREQAGRQRRFMNGRAAASPMGHGFYLWSSLPVKKIVCVPKAPETLRIRSDWVFRTTEDAAYPPVNGQTTYYVCEQGRCLPPVNRL